jgi:hypothetical protein
MEELFGATRRFLIRRARTGTHCLIREVVDGLMRGHVQVEQRTENPRVGGSIPSLATI